MPTYSFTFPASLAGQRVTVFDALGNGVENRVLTASGGQAIADFDLPSGSYEARVDGADGDNAKAVLDDDSIAAGGGGTPTADTAFLIATGTVATDGAFHVESLEFDDRFPQVDWLTIDAGTAVIPDGAGKCTIGIIGGASADFSGTTPPDDSGTIGGQVGFFVNDSSLVGSAFTEALGDGQDVQSLGTAPLTFATDPTDFDPGDVVTVKGKVYAFSDVDQEVSISDGVATVTIAVAITRGGSAPTLP